MYILFISENVSKICKHCNIKKLNAKKSSEKSEELFLARFIANTESYEDVAIVTQVNFVPQKTDHFCRLI